MWRAERRSIERTSRSSGERLRGALTARSRRSFRFTPRACAR
ncbi:hypothetical protein DB32_001327 [Sandaracinus amylolyticus]|uniref:Uncharacterized protein n=1 Tax=Sandaracinus amylolyticus TaxID=927083 RepID=A0A0F6YFY4_9BACT|nr:hypothetical protein DB32_001327 [Sandaracinus amylolyticus]